MKKRFVAAAAALIATAVAVPAGAAEFSYGGSMRFNYVGGDTGTVSNIDGFPAEETLDIWEYRVRQFFNLKVNDHVSTNVKLEWNPEFGDEQQIAGGAGDLQFGSGANEVQFRIKNAFLKFDVPGAPVSLTIGQQDFSTPKALISVEDGTGIKLAVKAFGGEHSIWWQRLSRGANNATGADDGDWFGIAPVFNVGDVSISPHLSWVKAGPGEATLPGTEVTYLGVDATGKLGGVGFTADFIYQTGETGPTGQFDVSSFIFDASVSLAAGPGTLTVKGLYSPGDDAPADNDVESWLDVIATDMGWSPFFHDGADNAGFILNYLPGAGQGGNPNFGNTAVGGVMAVGLEYAMSPAQNLSVTPNLYYLVAAEDVNTAGGTPDDFYGVEAGVQTLWKVWDAVEILGQFDYLFAGDVYKPAGGDAKDAWRLILGPRISW